jgi:peptidoglycan/LPS O-acetylase OafA/YrhL
MTLHQWTRIAASLTLVGAAAWLAKIGVIVATDGRVIHSGAAAWLMRVGLVCLPVGGTGLGLWLARRRGTPARVAAVLVSPVAVLAATAAAGVVSTAAVGSRGPAYLPQEAGIVGAGVLWLAVGAGLLARVRSSTAPAARTSR